MDKKKQKIEKKYVYYGLGFPVVLENVTMMQFRGVWLPDIDLNVLQQMVFYLLFSNPSLITEAHFRFMKNYLELQL